MASFLDLESHLDRYHRIADKVPFSKVLRLKSFLQTVHETYYIARDSETPLIYALVGVFGVGYVVFPGDFDFIPLLGWIDDASVFNVCNLFIRRRASPEVISRAKERTLTETGMGVISQVDVEPAEMTEAAGTIWTTIYSTAIHYTKKLFKLYIILLVILYLGLAIFLYLDYMNM